MLTSARRPHAPGAAGSAEAKLPFCDRTLGFAARTADLVARLNSTEQTDMFFSYPGTPYIERYNMKTWSLDHTCIHGMNKQNDVTVFPHAIAQGASWDRDLVTRVSNATAIEARILSDKTYAQRGESMGGALSCDGGPLANSAHDPRWGRISETYGEDPYHIQTIGVTAMKGLQNPQPVPGGKPEDAFFATRQVTRHYIGYHGASPDISGHTTYIASNRSLADSYFPTYGSFQKPTAGFADGIMCAMSLLNGVPSCANPLLLTTMLRETWKSDAIVQSDCCDSVNTMVKEISPHTGQPVVNRTEALGLAVNEGLGAYFGYDVGDFRNSMADLLLPAPLYGNGEKVSADRLKAVAQRVLLSHFRLGFYDEHAGDFPFANSTIDWSLINSAKHRALSREAAAKSTVLLKNTAKALPFPSSGGPKTIAVVGPFAACMSTATAPSNLGCKGRGGCEAQCYLHSYNGFPSNTTTIFGGIAAAGTKTGATVTYAHGSNLTCPQVKRSGGAVGDFDCVSEANSSGFYSPAAAAAIAEAVTAAKSADVTVLAVGLGAIIEAEGNDRVNVRTHAISATAYFPRMLLRDCLMLQMTLPSVQRELLKAVSAVAKKLVLVVVSAGGVDLDETKAAAVVWAPYGGEEAGSGLADVLFGAVNPSARLPVTVYKQAWADTMNCKNFTESPGKARKYNGDCATSILQLDLERGVGRTHRYLTDPATHVKHAFGYGLSYTTFAYSGLKAAYTAANKSVSVLVTVKNSGDVDGAEVIQVYARPPGSESSASDAQGAPKGAPLQNLIGFIKVDLPKGTSKTVDVPIDAVQMETAMEDGTRSILPGSYSISVGGHQPGDKEGTAGTSGAAVTASVAL